MLIKQVLDGSDGARAKSDSWPAFHESVVHASPLLYDYDKDNVKDILLATYDGEILVIKDTVSFHLSYSSCLDPAPKAVSVFKIAMASDQTNSWFPEDRHQLVVVAAIIIHIDLYEHFNPGQDTTEDIRVVHTG